MARILGERARVGVLVPATNTVVEPELYAMAPIGVTFHFGRMRMRSVAFASDVDARELVDSIRAGVGEALRAVLACEPTCLMVGMASVAYRGGVEGHRGFKEELERDSLSRPGSAEVEPPAPWVCCMARLRRMIAEITAELVAATRRSAMVYEPSARYGVTVFDVEIPREAGALLARVYQPQGPGPFPMLLDVHGGAWSRGDRTTDEQWVTPLAESGLLVLSPEFRVGPDPHPGQMQDINLATRWFKANAAKLNGDPATLGGIGISSGGHTVVLSAMRPRDPSYCALPLSGAQGEDASLHYVISMWPVIDPYDRYQWAKAQNNEHLVKCHDGYFLSVEAMIEASPPRMLERGEKVALPSLLLMHGTEDDNVPFDLVKGFARQWQEAGGDASVEPFEGERHGFGRQPGAVRDRVFAAIKGYVQRCLAGKVPVS